VLDGREVLLMARDIHEGTLPKEPFYRAPFYPALLVPLAAPHISDAVLAALMQRA
jgi:hypothetical protein